MAREQVKPKDFKLGFVHDSLISSIGFRNLADLGYINIPNAAVEVDFAQDPKKTTGKYAYKEAAQDLHPVLRRDRWNNLTTEQWDALQDVLQLVSRILDDPSIHPFVDGMLYGNKPLDSHETKYVTKTHPDIPAHHRRRFDRHYSSRDFSATTMRRLIWGQMRLAESVRWEFSTELAESVLGRTAADENLPGIEGWRDLPPGQNARGAGVTISLDQDFINVLTGNIHASDRLFTWDLLRIDDQSALLRTKLLLAIIMLHEFMHSMWISRQSLYFPPDPSKGETGGWNVVHEPYFRDHRINELGHAFTSEIFGYEVDPNGYVHAAVPYGLHSRRWPGLGDYSLAEPLASAAKWGTPWETHYLCDMKWVQSLFTRRFWTHDVPAKGMLEALRPPRELGMRFFPMPLFYEDESPTRNVKPVRFGARDSPASDDEDEDLGTGLVTRGRYRGQLSRVVKARKPLKRGIGMYAGYIGQLFGIGVEDY